MNDSIELEAKIVGLQYVVDGINSKCSSFNDRVFSIENKIERHEEDICEMRDILSNFKYLIDNSKRDVKKYAFRIVISLISVFVASTTTIIIFIASSLNTTYNNIDCKISNQYQKLDEKISENNKMFINHISDK
ncbi:MAG: hypothetical protein EHM12_11160 [Dehalococcoidia bacterium]|nr:MAG: hypothetical protein EHM12_11160 [Dehalococcoidia bacterium]